MEGNISSSSGKSVTVQFQLRTLSPADRKRNATRALGVCWGLSIATLPLPPIHWLTVPGFFLFGIYWSLRKWREGTHFESFQFSCPECGGEVQVAPQPLQRPLGFVCPKCRYGLKLNFPG